MDPLEEAHLVIFGTNAPVEMSRADLAERAVEGLSPTLHGINLVSRCREAIVGDPNLPVPTRDWAKHELAPQLTPTL